MSEIDTSETWQPRREWNPPLETRVVDVHPHITQLVGTVVRCDQLGHFADPYWLADVLWDSGVLERNLNTIWLTREDGTQ